MLWIPSSAGRLHRRTSEYAGMMTLGSHVEGVLRDSVELNAKQLRDAFEVMREPYAKRSVDMVLSLVQQAGCQAIMDDERVPFEKTFANMISAGFTDFVINAIKWELHAGVIPMSAVMTSEGHFLPVVVPYGECKIYRINGHRSGHPIYRATRVGGPTGLNSTDGRSFRASSFFKPLGTHRGASSLTFDDDASLSLGYLMDYALDDDGYDPSIFVLVNPEHEPDSMGNLNSIAASLVPSFKEMQFLELAHRRQQAAMLKPNIYVTKPGLPASVQKSMFESSLPPEGPRDMRTPVAIVEIDADVHSQYKTMMKQRDEDIAELKRNIKMKFRRWGEAPSTDKEISDLHVDSEMDFTSYPYPLPPGCTVYAVPHQVGSQLLIEKTKLYIEKVCTLFKVPLTIFNQTSTNESSAHTARATLFQNVMGITTRMSDIVSTFFHCTYGEDAFNTLFSHRMRAWMSRKGLQKIVELSRSSDSTIRMLLNMQSSKQYLSDDEAERLMYMTAAGVTPEDQELLESILKRFPKSLDRARQEPDKATRLVAIDEIFRRLVLLSTEQDMCDVLKSAPQAKRDAIHKHYNKTEKHLRSCTVRLVFPCIVGRNMDEMLLLFTLGLCTSSELVALGRGQNGLSTHNAVINKHTIDRLDKMQDEVMVAVTEKLANDVIATSGLKTRSVLKKRKSDAESEGAAKAQKTHGDKDKPETQDKSEKKDKKKDKETSDKTTEKKNA